MKKLNTKKIYIRFIFVLTGALLGHLYFSKVGCLSESCLITSSPRFSALYGAFFAYLISDFFIDKTKTESNKKNINL